MWKTFPRETLAGYQKGGPSAIGRIGRRILRATATRASTKRMDIIKTGNESALKYSRISYDFREEQRYCFARATG